MVKAMVLALVLLAPVSAFAAADEAAAKKLASDFTAAWNRGDSAAIAALYAADAVLTAPDGRTARGRNSIEGMFATDLREKAGSKLAFSANEFREVGTGGMVWRCEWKMTGLKGAASTASGTGLAVLVAEKDGWLIVEDLAALTPTIPAEKVAPKKRTGHGHDHGPGGHSHGDGDHGHDH